MNKERIVKLPDNITIEDVKDTTEFIHANHEVYVEFLIDNKLGAAVSESQLVDYELYKLSRYREDLKKEINENA